jgi:hypothetical protein
MDLGFDDVWYGKAQRLWSGETDFELWRDGDETAVGDQEFSAVGQRARIHGASSLPRC